MIRVVWLSGRDETVHVDDVEDNDVILVGNIFNVTIPGAILLFAVRVRDESLPRVCTEYSGWKEAAEQRWAEQRATRAEKFASDVEAMLAKEKKP